MTKAASTFRYQYWNYDKKSSVFRRMVDTKPSAALRYANEAAG